MSTPTLEESDIIRNSHAEVDMYGFAETRVFRIGNLDQTFVAGIKFAAYNAWRNLTGLDYGSPHPAVPGAYIRKIDIEPFTASGKTSCYIKAHYVPPQGGDPVGGIQIRITGANRYGPTQFDASGNLMRVGYQFVTTTGAGVSTNFVPNFVRQYVQTDTLLPFAIIEYTLRVSKNDMPSRLRYLGTINSDPWNGFGPHRWLCRNVTADSVNNATSYITTFTFEVSGLVGGWDKYELFYDSTLHQTPQDVGDDLAKALATSSPPASGNGWGRFQVYPELAFGQLSFPEPLK